MIHRLAMCLFSQNSNRPPLLTSALIAASVLGAATSVSVVAQQETSFLEEIVITAERREVNLQDTPISATVLSSEAMITKGVNSIDDIQNVAPSVAISTVNRSTFINIRGVGIAQSAPTSNPGVAYYIDGVFIPHEQFISQSFFDYGSVEVLRGPQGTLTGQNSTGGAIYITTPRPDTTETYGYVDQTAGSDGWLRTVGAVNIPMGDVTALRLAGIYEEKDGFMENTASKAGMTPGSSELLSLRANLLFEPSDSQSYKVLYESFDLETGNIALKNRNDPNPDPYELNEDGRSYLNQKGYRASIDARWTLANNMELRTLLSTQDGYTKDQSDGDRTATAPPVPMALPANSTNRELFPGRVSKARTDFETDILEINLLSSEEGSTTWVLGAFYMTDDVPVDLRRDNYNTTDFVSSSSTIAALAENTSQSVFGQVDTSLSQDLVLTLGARYSEDEQVYTRFSLPPFGTTAYPFPFPPSPPAPPIQVIFAGRIDQCDPEFPCTSVQESSEVTGRIGLNYNTSENTLYYVTLSKGYKAGGVNLDFFSDPKNGVFEPETNAVLELGFKTTVADGRVRINGDVFYSDYEDMQLSSLSGGLPLTQNAASAEIYGLELEMMGAFNALSYNLGVAFLNGTFAEDTIINDTVLDGLNMVDEGDDLPFTPDITLNAGIQYDFLVGDTVLTPRFQVSYISDQLADPFEYDQTTIDSRTVADLRAKATFSENFMVEAFITNIFDEEYLTSQIRNSSSADGGELYGPPRQFGARIKYDF